MNVKRVKQYVRIMAIIFFATILVLTIDILNVSASGNENSEIFAIRSTYPESTDANAKYYYDSKYSPFLPKYGMPNCTTYVWGRVYEVTGKRPKLSTGNAGVWYSDNIENGHYPYGSTPQVGAVACYDGHVAFVEKIVGNTVWVSESAWSGHSNPENKWFYRTKETTDTYSGKFQGYIYTCAEMTGDFNAIKSVNVSDITDTTAKITANLNGVYGVTTCGFYYGTDQNNMTRVSKDESINGSATEAKTVFYTLGNGANTPALSPGTTYYYQMFVTIGGKEYKSEISSFTTTGQSINHNPQSWLDSATGGNSGFIISGWAFDPDAPTQSLQVDVYIGGPYGQGGTLIASLTANQLREDVGLNYPGVGNYHGFYGEIATDRVGEQPIYVYAINVGEGTENPLIGSSVVNITDTIKPVVTNAYVSQKDQDGYTVTATVYDNAGVAQIKFPTKRKDQEGDQYWQWLDGSQNADGSYSCRINLNDFDNVTGGYLTEVRAWDAAGNVSDPWRLPEQFMDKDKPVVTSVEITQADASGYIVTATVTDNVGVAKVQFPTKRKEQEGDQYWQWLDATQNADGSYSCRINISDFNNVTGHYLTEVRAWDAAGNVSDPGRCPEQFYDMSAPRITSGNIISNEKNGYIVSAMIEDDVAVSKVQFAAKLKEQDEQQWKVFEGIKNSDGTYSCKINASDFDNTTGYYLTTAKAWDTYGNVSDVYQFAEQFIDRVAPEIQDIYESKWFEMSSVIEVEATDNVGITDLQLRVRKENANEWQWLTSESTENGKWIFNIDFQKLTSGCGSYIAQAVVSDAAGNENVSEVRGFSYDPYRWKLQIEMYAVNNNEGRIEQIYSVDKNGYQSKIDWRKFLNPILSDDMVSQAEYVDTLNKYNAEKEQIPTAFEEIDAACTQLTGKENDVHLYWKKLAAEYLNLSGEEKEAYLESVPTKSEAFIENAGDYFEQYWEIESHNWSEIFELLSTTEDLDYYEIIAISQILSEAKIECYLANSAEEVQTIINSVNEFRLAGFPEYIKLVKGEIPESNYFGKVINGTDKNKNSFYGDLVEGRAELINNVLSTEDKEKLDAGKDVKIWMTLNELQNNVSENDKNLIAEKLGEYIIGAYTDITLWKQFDNESEEKISEIPGTITIMLELPEELINKNTLKERSYAIIYAHEWC